MKKFNLKKYFLNYYFLAVGIATFIGFLEITLGMKQFGGYDGGIMINATYQQFLGYRPYQDFFSAFPVGFLLGGKLAFKLFGVRWLSFVMLGAIFSSISFLLHLSILVRLKVGKIWALAIPFTCQCLTTIPISYWWYNQITAISGILFLSASILLYKQPKATYAQVLFLLTATLLMLMKANIAGFLIVSVIIISIFSKLRFRILLLMIISTLLFLSILLLTKINLSSMIDAYFSAKGRVYSIDSILYNLYSGDRWEVITSFVLFLPIALIFLLTSKFLLENKTTKTIPIIAIILITVATGFIGMATNNDYNMVDAAFIFMGTFFLILFTFAKNRYPIIINILMIVGVSLLIVYGLFLSLNRRRIASIGGDFYQQETIRPMQTPYLFKGLYAPRLFYDVNSQIAEILNKADLNGKKDANIFFGPRIDFGYAAYGINPPKGLPLYFESEFTHLGLSTQDKKSIEDFKSKKFKLGIFLKRDYTLIPRDLEKYLYANYYVYEDGYLTIHILKNEDSLQLLKSKLDREAKRAYIEEYKKGEKIKLRIVNY